ncbi:IS110 family transposase [Sphingosinicella microcystinivorans]|jgi:transposase|uniref:Transposase n=1 Tax=Sphingosinicella microcystinivorans TaxID=335406 RepID=A0AAD1D308_SPHMI|nr:IS110 family transposase [Sphingosinicella microcystinivorans]RKS88643.1 transposase [Sphingosinicella microcystinivorans]BBE32389.1 IS110 family transposase [Sphingosinicella microcystinivorans]
MSIFAGLDVSDKTTHVCVVDTDGVVLKRDVVASDPDVLAKWLGKHCSGLARVVLETGPLSTFLYHGLTERSIPVECICARHAKGVLAARVNKSDVHDAEGLAQLARTGWFKRVHMKASATHIDRAALRIRAQLITTRVAMGNQLRGLLKLFGLRLGAARTPGKRRERLIALYQQRPDLEPLFAPLVTSMEIIEEQLRASNRLLESRATEDVVCSRLMTVPGVGPITALTFTASVEDPHRFARSEDVGAYAGLVPRRSQSGERDVNGNISKAGDPMLRRSLYEAANIMLCRVQRPFALQQWGQRIAESKGNKRARIAVARKLAVLLHSLWVNETEFRWA